MIRKKNFLSFRFLLSCWSPWGMLTSWDWSLEGMREGVATFGGLDVWKANCVHFSCPNVTRSVQNRWQILDPVPWTSAAGEKPPRHGDWDAAGAHCQHNIFPTCRGICGMSCSWLWHQHKLNWSKQMRRGIIVYPDGLWIDKWAETIGNSNPLCLCRRKSQWLQQCQNVLKASLQTLMPIMGKTD